MERTFLSEIKENQICTIDFVNCKDNLKSRLTDLGLIPETKVKCVNIAMGGTPLALDIRGSIIALRKSDCESIGIKSVENIKG